MKVETTATNNDEDYHIVRIQLDGDPKGIEQILAAVQKLFALR